jgi:hypothetical protein
MTCDWWSVCRMNPLHPDDPDREMSEYADAAHSTAFTCSKARTLMLDVVFNSGACGAPDRNQPSLIALRDYSQYSLLQVHVRSNQGMELI